MSSGPAEPPQRLESVRTREDETRSSIADTDDNPSADTAVTAAAAAERENEDCGDSSSVRRDSKSRLFFTKLLRIEEPKALEPDGNFRLEDARLLWRYWRIISLVTPVRQFNQVLTHAPIQRPSVRP